MDLDIPRLGGQGQSEPYLKMLIAACMVIPGTLLGRHLVKGVSERHFLIAYRAALTLAGLKVLVFDGLRNLPLWG